MKPLTFSGSSVRIEGALLRLQLPHQTLRRAGLIKQRRLYLDTPDERLRRRDHWLFLERRSGLPASLSSGRSSEIEFSAQLDREPDFLWNMPDDLTGQFRPIIKMRRLSVRLRADLKIQAFRMEDRRQKTVARVQLVGGRVFRPGSRKGRPLSPRLIAMPLKGYQKPFERLVSRLRSSLEFWETTQSIYQESLEVLGLSVSRKIVLPEIAPGMSTFDGMQQILGSIQRVIEANSESLEAPEDSEFLHRFRVAIRQTRTLLSQSRNCFLRRDVRRFSSFFAWLGKTSGAARDLDVYLLKLNGYDSDWPDRFGPHLPNLRSRLERARATEQARLIRILKSRRYRRGMDAWKSFLEAPAPRVREAGENIEIFASAKIWNCYRKIRKAGKKLVPNGPAKPIHRMRIRFKKLRYLIEFLSPLFSKGEISQVLSEIKNMQDDLGNFNDCMVQAAWLEEQSHQEGDQSLLGQSLAVLSKDLKNQSGHLTETFWEGFQRFLRPQNRRLFRRLFQGPKSLSK